MKKIKKNVYSRYFMEHDLFVSLTTINELKKKICQRDS